MSVDWLDLLADRSARRWLRRIEERLRSGWTSVSTQPDVQRQFHTHLSAVADVVRCEAELVHRSEPVTTLVLLAAHGHEVFQDANRLGWSPPRQEDDWSAAEWFGLRLLACYWLAGAERRGPPRPKNVVLPDASARPSPSAERGEGLPPPTEGEGRRRQA